MKKNSLKNKIEIISLILIVILALVLRYIALINLCDPWYDEIFSWFFAKQDTVSQTISIAVNQDVHMPLYFVLLHFWIKFFGDEADTMRLLSYIISIPLVPVAYYFARKLFNRTCAYFIAIYLAINMFCIYYCLEIRMYCINLLASLVMAFAFTFMLKDFKRRYAVLYIFFAIILLYNFTISALLIFSYFIVGLIYLLIEKREFIKKFILVHFLIFLFAFPALYLSYFIYEKVQGAIIYYPYDIFPFKKEILIDILENFFTRENVQITYNSYYFFHNIFKRLDELSYLFYVIVPVIIGLFGLIRAFLSKRKEVYLFLIPSFLFFIVLLLLAINHMAVIQTRYLTLIFCVMICAFCYGISSFKSKIVSISIFSLFILIYLIGAINLEKSVFDLHRHEIIESVTGNLIKFRSNDLILMPESGKVFMYYFKKGKMIPFYIDDFLVANEKESGKFYFGDDYKKITRDNIKNYIMDDAINEIVSIPYENNLLNFINTMDKNQRFILIAPSNMMLPLHEKMAAYKKTNKKDYPSYSLVYSKVHRDSFLIANKYLKLKEHYSMYGKDYFIFEKE